MKKSILSILLIVLFSSCLLFTVSAASNDVIKEIELTSLQPIYYKIGYGDKYVYNQDLNGNKISLSIDGKETEYDKGVFAHAYSVLQYEIDDPNYQIVGFKSDYGITKSQRNNYMTSMVFEVYANHKKVYNSSIIDRNNPSGSIDVELEKTNSILLVIDSLETNANDHGAWANPILVLERK